MGNVTEAKLTPNLETGIINFDMIVSCYLLFMFLALLFCFQFMVVHVDTYYPCNFISFQSLSFFVNGPTGDIQLNFVMLAIR